MVETHEDESIKAREVILINVLDGNSCTFVSLAAHPDAVAFKSHKQLQAA